MSVGAVLWLLYPLAFLVLNGESSSLVDKRSQSLAFLAPMPVPRTVERPFDLPLGATYRHSMRFPVLGQQAFQIRVLSGTSAHLSISGMLTIDEVVPYTVDEKGRLRFSLSAKTKEILKKFKTRLLEAGYDPYTDTPYVKVAPYVLPAVRINMNRLKEERLL